MSAPSTEKLRAWYSHRQGLDGRLAGKDAAAVLAETGWARSVGGVGPYLTLHARAGISREAADRAIARLEIYELPTARGCTYVLPACDFALGIRAGEGFAGSEVKVAAKLGVTDKEIARLCDAVTKALEKGPLTPDELREATGKASRSLGEEGKKKGLTTTLPLALGLLQVSADIRRVPLNGRVDQQRYKYTLWRPNPLAKYKLSAEEVATEIARRFFTWIGPATLEELQWFTAFGVKKNKAAVEPLKLVPLAAGDARLMLPEHRDAFESFKAPKEARYRLVSSIDGLALLRRDLPMDETDRKRSFVTDEGTQAGSALKDLPSHAIVDRGRVVGLWEYDPETESIAWMPFIAKNKELEKAVRETEDYVRAQLGDARSFSLDSPKKRAPRIAALRKAGK